MSISLSPVVVSSHLRHCVATHLDLQGHTRTPFVIFTSQIKRTSAIQPVDFSSTLSLIHRTMTQAATAAQLPSAQPPPFPQPQAQPPSLPSQPLVPPTNGTTPSLPWTPVYPALHLWPMQDTFVMKMIHLPDGQRVCDHPPIVLAAGSANAYLDLGSSRSK